MVLDASLKEKIVCLLEAKKILEASLYSLTSELELTKRENARLKKDLDDQIAILIDQRDKLQLRLAEQDKVLLTVKSNAAILRACLFCMVEPVSH